MRAKDRHGKQVVATSGRGGAGSSRSGNGRQRPAAPIMVDDVNEEEEEQEDDNMFNQHGQVQYLLDMQLVMEIIEYGMVVLQFILSIAISNGNCDVDD
jgi:hypothetical protein